MSKLTIFMGAAATAAVLATSAHAVTLYASVTEADNSRTASWAMSSTPQVDQYGEGVQVVVSVEDYGDWVNSGPYSNEIQFFNSTITTSWLDGDFIMQGPQIYTGSESAPVFSPGVWSVFDSSSSSPATFALSLTPPGVPEPSTWAMMLVGVGLLGAGARARRVALA
jgi:PEP-CTERM motif